MISAWFVSFSLVYWGLTPQQQPGSYQGGEMMMMKSVFWRRKPEYPEETTDLRQFVNNGCNFMKFVERSFVPRVLSHGSDVLVRFKIRRWGETGLLVGSAFSFGSSIGYLLGL